MAQNTKIAMSVYALLTGASDLGDASTIKSLSYSKDMGSGTGAGLADMVWADIGQLAASGTVDIDLAGSLTGPLGGTLTFARVKAIFVYADEGNTNNVVVGAAAATQFVGPFGASTHTVALQPGGAFMITAPTATGWAVTAGSTDFLRLTNSAGSTVVNYKIVIIGASA